MTIETHMMIDRPLIACLFGVMTLLSFYSALHHTPFEGKDASGAYNVVSKIDSLPIRFGFGRPATAEKIAQFDTDVRPDGAGLPAGSGTATQGAVIFSTKCAACHGAGGTGGPNGSLVITASTSKQPDKKQEKVIGNYWPYATTVFDYIKRAMPFNAPGSLTDDEVYALTAFLLHANGITDDKVVLNARTLPKINMPAQPQFVPDDRKGGTEIR